MAAKTAAVARFDPRNLPRKTAPKSHIQKRLASPKVFGKRI
jgi:hypothetical protein